MRSHFQLGAPWIGESERCATAGAFLQTFGDQSMQAIEAFTEIARVQWIIEDFVPASIRPLVEEFGGVRGGRMHEGLSGRTLIYARFVRRRSD